MECVANKLGKFRPKPVEVGTQTNQADFEAAAEKWAAKMGGAEKMADAEKMAASSDLAGASVAFDGWQTPPPRQVRIVILTVYICSIQ